MTYLTPFTLSKASSLQDILAANKKSIASINPQILKLSGKGQSPHTLWIGCSDSRVNECTTLGCVPGEIFTVRNVANVVTYDDPAAQSAIQFAIESLKVSRIIVCGHTDCGGIRGTLANRKSGGPLDNWLLPIRETRYQHRDELEALESEKERITRLSELNVLHSVDTVRKHPSFVKAHKEKKVEVYGIIYDVETGYIRELPTIERDGISEVFELTS
ncbi:DEKNAAC101696 [Brettanomyces naardenensis]|uniref:Carbonic anhydrase n=1 Tax=Brettanomyces naardenensis TaxID=13370 RepID=A0A448YIL6_BRENA|nr:DEKNAAC101696 [Brettanomyces naardenensis]